MRTDPLIEDWLEGLARINVTWMELRAGAKAPARAWSYYQAIHADRGPDLELAQRWMKRGGLAFLPANGLWAFDADTKAAEERAIAELACHRIACPIVRTPGGGRHFYAMLPPDLKGERLKAHVHVEDEQRGIKADFKLTGRTSLVAPGTMRNDFIYHPESSFWMPPVVDPRAFWPDLELFRSDVGHLVDEREDINKRCASAVARIRSTPGAVKGEKAHQRLSQLAGNVVAYHRIDPGLAVCLLTRPAGTSWADRCKPPMPHDVLWRACESAVDAVSTVGRQAYLERAKRADRDAALNRFADLLHQSRRANSWTLAMDLMGAFQRWSGDVEIDPITFGRIISRQGFTTKLKSKARLTAFEDIDLDTLLRLLRQAA